MVSYEASLSGKRRAVTEALKDARRDAILAAARDLFRRRSFESLAMSDIARAANVAKGTLYLYFRTREEIFLALLSRDYAQWFAAFADALPRCASPGAALDWIVDSLSSGSELLHLVALLHSVLERNIPVETARAFKLGVEAGLSAIAPELARVLRLESEAQAQRFLYWLQACVVGIHQLSTPGPTVRAAIADEPRLQGAVLDFQKELRALLGAALAGMHEQEKTS